jgi:hypothetical protein
MLYQQSRVLRIVAVSALVTVATAFAPTPTAVPSPGMTFRMKVVFKHTPTSGRQPRAVTLLGHGQFASGLGRVDIDTVDAPAAIRKGDFFIIRDSTNTFWGRPSNKSVRKMPATLSNPLEGISDRLTSGMGSPRSLKVDFDTVSLDEMVNGMRTRHFRITADVVYPVGDRQITQKVVVEHWLTKLPVRILNPFGSRVRGLPSAPLVNAAYREFIRTLIAANKVFGDDVTVRTVTSTSYIYGRGLGEDFLQTVDMTELQQADVDERTFQLSAEYKMQTAPRDTVVPPRKPPTPKEHQ